MKKILLNFEKKGLKNQELRIKFLDQPEKFMEAEMELHDGIQEMHNIATVPEHYPILVELNTVPSLLGLLSHENTDISVAVVDLLQVMRMMIMTAVMLTTMMHCFRNSPILTP